MSDEIRARASSKTSSKPTTAQRRLIPMRVGKATVYVEEVGEPAIIEAGDRIRPVAPPSPEDAFQRAGDILNECVRVLGERVDALASKIRPQEVTVEFSLSFQVKGTASLIPIFVTGETGAETGLKVTAVWKHQDGKDT